MYGVDLYRRVRLACHREGLSRREASRQFGIDRLHPLFDLTAVHLLRSRPRHYREHHSSVCEFQEQGLVLVRIARFDISVLTSHL